MADLITLTTQPIRQTTGSNVLQPIYLSVDVAGYDFLDLEAGIVGIEGGVTQFTLDLYTGMQNQTDDGWVSAANLVNQASPVTNSWYKTTISSGLLRYVRWRATAVTGGTALTFFVRGMARKYA